MEVARVIQEMFLQAKDKVKKILKIKFLKNSKDEISKNAISKDEISKDEIFKAKDYIVSFQKTIQLSIREQRLQLFNLETSIS